MTTTNATRPHGFHIDIHLQLSDEQSVRNLASAVHDALDVDHPDLVSLNLRHSAPLDASAFGFLLDLARQGESQGTRVVVTQADEAQRRAMVREGLLDPSTLARPGCRNARLRSTCPEGSTA